LCLIVCAGHPVTALVYGTKWLPAVVPLQLFAVGMCCHVITWLVGTTLVSIGKVTYNTNIVLLRTVAQLALGVVGVFYLGFIAVPLAGDFRRGDFTSSRSAGSEGQ
jgi:O-antigen/teichoic acid export membrane protein